LSIDEATNLSTKQHWIFSMRFEMEKKSGLPVSDIATLGTWQLLGRH